MFCGKCGKQIPETSKFCEYCGASLLPEEETGAGKQKSPQSRGKRNASFGKLCVMGVFLLLAAGGILLVKKQSDSREKEAEVVKEITDNRPQEPVEMESTEETRPLENTEEEGAAFAETVGEEAGEARETETAGETAEEAEEETALSQNAEANEFLLPDIAVRFYPDEELLALSEEELRLARNEIYARHGRIFQTEELNGYFSSKTWYEPRYTAEQMNAMGDAFLNEYERANRDRIIQAESAKKGERSLRVVNCQESITLRWEPDTEAEEICQIPLGATVMYKGMGEGMFYQIEYEGLSGYALSTYFAEAE